MLRHWSTPHTETRESALMNSETNTAPIILVVEDVHETRDGIEKLLNADGYRVAVARDERDAIQSARDRRPDLILVSLGGLPSEVIATARQVRERADVGDDVPIVVFCVAGIGEGDEVAIGQNVHVTRPDNFNQLRRLLIRLLQKVPIAASRDTARPQPQLQ
jgi:CheY-like chemotaxis protein